MSKVSDYAFVNAKLRARIGIMRSSHLIDAMIKAPSLGEAVSKLEGTRFGHIAEVYRSTGDLQQAELSMMEEEIASYREIAGYLHWLLLEHCIQRCRSTPLCQGCPFALSCRKGDER